MKLDYIQSKKLPRNFYCRPAPEVAPDLLGKLFVKIYNQKIIAGVIVEVEAYTGELDQASHSYNGLTKRNEVMFGECGHLYVYFTYGMYYCCNVVTGSIGDGQAVLIRGLEPIEGMDIMQVNRFGDKKVTNAMVKNISNGPGKICMAFGIDKKHNGLDLTGNCIYICEYKKVEKTDIQKTTRIGIKKSTELPWRFYLTNSTGVSNLK